ncbi:MAG: cupredoxin domain-containing protein [Actinomycetota bacterium]
MRKILTATAMILGLVAASCANDGSSPGAGGYGGGGSAVSSGAASPTATATADGGRYGYGSGGSGSGSGSGGGGGPVTGSVVAANYAFTPTNVTVASGATIQVKNSTPETPHTFTVTGEDIDVALDPQSTAKVTIDLSPGTYGFECRFHAGSGMKGTLIVT